MTEQFTPTTEQVRTGYAVDPEAEYRDPITNYTVHGERAFDRWLAAHDAEVLASVQPPTREQIAAIDRLRHRLRNAPDWANDVCVQRADLDVVLALFPQPTPSAEPMIPVALIQNAPHDDWCGARKFPRRECDCWKQWVASLLAKPRPPAEPVSIADMAPGTTFNCPERWTVGPPNLQGRQWAFRSGEGRYLDEFDASTIRDVTPPPATPKDGQ